MDILQTRNRNYGFYGMFGRHDNPGAVWSLAMEAIAKATGCPAECIRTFLESRQGRIFAEGVVKHMSKNALETVETAVDAAVARWMDFTIRSEDGSKYGITVGLPYLKGFACHCKLEADTGEGDGWPPYNPFG
jgi:hypothetical protein